MFVCFAINTKFRLIPLVVVGVNPLFSNVFIVVSMASVVLVSIASESGRVGVRSCWVHEEPAHADEADCRKDQYHSSPHGMFCRADVKHNCANYHYGPRY